jgi:hypothetical protein
MENIDLEKLARGFGIDEDEDCEDPSSSNHNENLEIITDSIDITNPDKILEDNIFKANVVLDKILSNINSGRFTPRMGEVAGQLVNAVTNAVEKVFARDAGIKNLLIKDKMLGLKEKETDIKERIFEMKNSKKKNEKEYLVTDREKILQILNEGEPKNDD